MEYIIFVIKKNNLKKCFRSSVRVIQSQRPGVGKTLYVKRLVEKLRKHHPRRKDVSLSIHLYEKDVDISHIVDKLMMYQHSPEESNPVIFHLDISSEVLNGVDFLLYNLLILGCLKDKDGRIWTKSPSDLYVIENIPYRHNLADKKVSYKTAQLFIIVCIFYGF
ncbi:hypothetical protein SNE40_019790 [Patella caerulea]|uniref:Uncharacterized protein n=1 Tax=Patella caerulea TaxID=87958 RepID=A0AAN8J4H9_PATCE